MDYPGIDGFLGTRGSLMLDVVFVAMFAILPALAWSIWLVKGGRFQLHKRVQLALGLLLLVTVVLFEVDIRLHDWEPRATGSVESPNPYFDPHRPWGCPAGIALIVHLCFAVPTAVLWLVVTVRALRRFPNPPLPGAHSSSHKFWGWVTTFETFGTAITGWIFYWLAFVAAM